MDLSLSEPQQMLKTSAREFLERECPHTLVREMEEDERGYSPDVWRKMESLGWLGLPFPDNYGGTGGSLLDQVVLLEEMGRALLPGPYFSTVVLAGLTILDAGSERQREEFLPRICQGQVIMTMAITEPSASYEPQGIQLQATPTGEGFTLNGTKLFVHDAHIADYIIVAARTAQRPDPREGISLFILPAKQPGVEVTPLKTIASDKQFEVTFRDVVAGRDTLLGEVDKGWPILERAIQRAAVAKAAEMLGGAERVLEMTVEYVKQRIQFGRPIGSFQAIQHYCANMATDVEGCRYITYQAAWRISEGLPAAKEVSMAKAWVNDAYQRICALAHQCHGAIGFTKEHNLQLYTRRAKAAEFLFGDSDFHRELLAQVLEE